MDKVDFFCASPQPTPSKNNKRSLQNPDDGNRAPKKRRADPSTLNTGNAMSNPMSSLAVLAQQSQSHQLPTIPGMNPGHMAPGFMHGCHTTQPNGMHAGFHVHGHHHGSSNPLQSASGHAQMPFVGAMGSNFGQNSQHNLQSLSLAHQFAQNGMAMASSQSFANKTPTSASATSVTTATNAHYNASVATNGGVPTNASCMTPAQQQTAVANAMMHAAHAQHAAGHPHHPSAFHYQQQLLQRQIAAASAQSSANGLQDFGGVKQQPQPTFGMSAGGTSGMGFPNLQTASNCMPHTHQHMGAMVPGSSPHFFTQSMHPSHHHTQHQQVVSSMLQPLLQTTGNVSLASPTNDRPRSTHSIHTTLSAGSHGGRATPTFTNTGNANGKFPNVNRSSSGSPVSTCSANKTGTGPNRSKSSMTNSHSQGKDRGSLNGVPPLKGPHHCSSCKEMHLKALSMSQLLEKHKSANEDLTRRLESCQKEKQALQKEMNGKKVKTERSGKKDKKSIKDEKAAKDEEMEEYKEQCIRYRRCVLNVLQQLNIEMSNPNEDAESFCQNAERFVQSRRTNHGCFSSNGHPCGGKVGAVPGQSALVNNGQMKSQFAQFHMPPLQNMSHQNHQSPHGALQQHGGGRHFPVHGPHGHGHAQQHMRAQFHGNGGAGVHMTHTLSAPMPGGVLSLHTSNQVHLPFNGGMFRQDASVAPLQSGNALQSS